MLELECSSLTADDDESVGAAATWLSLSTGSFFTCTEPTTCSIFSPLLDKDGGERSKLSTGAGATAEISSPPEHPHIQVHKVLLVRLEVTWNPCGLFRKIQNPTSASPSTITPPPSTPMIAPRLNPDVSSLRDGALVGELGWAEGWAEG